MRTTINLLLGVGLIVGAAGTVDAQEPLPAHPNDLTYPPLDYELAPASQFRETLSNGMVVFIAEDRMLPTFDLNITLRTGGALEPPSKAGLASLTGEQMRDGGTKNLTPAQLDERVEFLAASLSSRISDTQGRASLSCLAKDVDEGLALLVEMLRYPRFDEERLRLAKEKRLQNIKRRNDSTSSISRIEWGFFMDGEDHFSNRYPSSKTVNALTRDDLFAFHRKYIHPGNMIVVVAGDFERGKMLQKLETVFGDWRVGETGPTTFPKPHHVPKAGVYVVHKEEVNQGRVSIGHKAIMRGSPDEFALQVMNGILGAAGFRSRLLSKIRSDEGLAYNTGSRFTQGVYYPGDFQCWFQTKSNACAYATKIVLDEINRLRDETVDQSELDEAVAYYVESFPQRFQTKMALLRTYASDEYTGRDPSYWQSYVEKLERVKPVDVRRVAQKYLHPSQLVIFAVGDADAMLAAGYDKAPDLRFETFGNVTRLPQRDPDTLRR